MRVAGRPNVNEVKAEGELSAADGAPGAVHPRYGNGLQLSLMAHCFSREEYFITDSVQPAIARR